MEEYQTDFADFLADSEALFFAENLTLKDQRPTPYFVNVGSFAKKASLRKKLAEAYAGMIAEKIRGGMSVDILFGPAYKGILLAGDAASALLDKYGIDLGVAFNRKEAKTHGEGSGKESALVGELFDGANVYIVDDVATSMGTKNEALGIIATESKRKKISANVVGIGIAVDREQVSPIYDSDGKIILNSRGEDAVRDFTGKTGIPVHSIVGIREAINYLYMAGHPVKINDGRTPISDMMFHNFQKYMKTYGTA